MIGMDTFDIRKNSVQIGYPFRASALSGGAVVSKMRMYGFQMLTFFCLTIAEKEEVSHEDLGF